MRYSIADAKALFERWHASQSIVRVTFSDVATGGMFSGLITAVGSDNLPTLLVMSVDLDILLVNGVRGSSKISVNFWGSEEIEFSDFTDTPSPMVSSDDLDRFNCCLSIQYETGSMLNICEVWPSPALETLRGSSVDASQFKAVLEFLNEQQNKKT